MLLIRRLSPHCAASRLGRFSQTSKSWSAFRLAPLSRRKILHLLPLAAELALPGNGSRASSSATRGTAAVEITNVYAVLRGTNPEDAKRIVLVTGHYDSRNSGPLDGTGIAPGANDDGSGTAVSLECARVLSKLKFPANIIFL